ncbi:hypothetical protein Pint_02609 [Pistacia integerrima]|uniref:Uncharacterized protein n=1 Tax=Pistacia integerrima TaxID=434235 RepID=A0ACC0ZIX1_9ROSI|nr:hypothetical protein Pint_02609 [Pistacia integerrima]
MTITLKDVALLLGLEIDGEPVLGWNAETKLVEWKMLSATHVLPSILGWQHYFFTTAGNKVPVIALGKAYLKSQKYNQWLFNTTTERHLLDRCLRQFGLLIGIAPSMVHKYIMQMHNIAPVIARSTNLYHVKQLVNFVLLQTRSERLHMCSFALLIGKATYQNHVKELGKVMISSFLAQNKADERVNPQQYHGDSIFDLTELCQATGESDDSRFMM